MVQQISDQLNLPRSSGTFEEFRPKVLLAQIEVGCQLIGQLFVRVTVLLFVV